MASPALGIGGADFHSSVSSGEDATGEAASAAVDAAQKAFCSAGAGGSRWDDTDTDMSEAARGRLWERERRFAFERFVFFFFFVR